MRSSSSYKKSSPLKTITQLFILAVFGVSLYYGVGLVQQRATLSTSASLTLNPSVSAILSFTQPVPPNPQTVGANFSTSVIVDTAGQYIFGVDTTINYDPSKLQVVSITPTTGNGFSSYPTKKFNNSRGEISLAANIGTGDSRPVSGSAVNVATIIFKVINPITTSSVTYQFTLGNRNDSNVIPEYNDRRKKVVDILGSVVPLSITTVPSASPSPSPSPSVSPSASPSPSPSPTVLPSPSPTPLNVSLTLGLQGKDSTALISPQSLTIKTQSATAQLPISTPISLTTVASSPLSLYPGSYVFLVKADNYLARSYGTLALPITVDASSTTLDLSGDPLLGGDFNNDGVINEIDYTTYFIPAFASTDAALDLDDSGQVNNLDFAIMRSNWGLVDDIIQ